MNTIKYAAGAAMMLTAVSMLSACSSDEAEKSYYPKDNVVRVTTNVNAPATRGSYNDANLSEMSLSIKNAESLDVYTYNNVRINKGEGSTVWTPERTMLWQSSKTLVDIVAYAPYNADYTLPEGTTSLCDVANFPVSVQATQTASNNASDFLVYKRTGFKPYTDLNTHSAIAVSFDHAMSLLEIQIALGTEFDATTAGPLQASPISGLVVAGTAISGTCDFANWNSTTEGSLPAITAGDTQATVSPYQTGFTPKSVEDNGTVNNAVATYECILLPQTVAAGNFEVGFDINGITYQWKSPDAVTLQGGYKHVLKLTVGKDQVLVNGLSVKKWDTTPATTDITTD